jgi:hypothetical protein
LSGALQALREVAGDGSGNLGARAAPAQTGTKVVLDDRVAAVERDGSISSLTRTPVSPKSSLSSGWISPLNRSNFDGRSAHATDGG